MKIKSLACSCALLMGLSGFAQADQAVDNEGKFNLLFGAGKYFADSDRDLDDGDAFEIGLGYIIDKHWAIEGVYSHIGGVDSEITGADVDVEKYRLDALYHFNRLGNHWTPYLAAGIGELNFDPKGADNDRETAVNFGGGVKYALTQAVAVRADVRAIFSDEEDSLDGLATLGLNYVFGTQSAKPVVAAPVDSDGDGVLDKNDKCPGTPAGVSVDAYGCALDSDRDGVPDYLDKCPGTKVGLAVDSDGCPRMATESVSIDLDVLFDTNKAVVKPAYRAEVQQVAEFMTNYPKSTAVIEGHTDDRGAANYNQDLSQRRADAVRSMLVHEMGVDTSRLSAVGYGEERPRASNDTAEGREQNRRVTAVISASVQKEVMK